MSLPELVESDSQEFYMQPTKPPALWRLYVKSEVFKSSKNCRDCMKARFNSRTLHDGQEEIVRGTKDLVDTADIRFAKAFLCGEVCFPVYLSGEKEQCS